MNSPLGKIKNRLRRLINEWSMPPNAETNALYKVLYDQVHDLDQAREIGNRTTVDAFRSQWKDLPEGEFLLSDPWFRDNVGKILSEQETLLRPEWFQGKKVLDAGCGNGRWAYGLCKLGAEVTCVDANQVALEQAKRALETLPQRPVSYICSPLEELHLHVAPSSFDLVFCWGVLHHCPSFTRSFLNLTEAVRDGGYLYLYLYGRESIPLDQDIEVFKQRVIYNVLLSDTERYKFLLRKARGDQNRLNAVHDFYAPLINRRLEFEYVKECLAARGFCDIIRTIAHTEIFVRASKGHAGDSRDTLTPTAPPYWFQRRRTQVSHTKS